MFSGFGKYKKYIDELTAILDASSEIIFLCNNFDITRIQDLFINIIENYNYYEQGKNETSKTELLGDEISGSAEYIKMKEYIDKNFENIKDKCDCFTIKLDGFRRQYLPDNAETEDSDDALIRDNFKSQYKTIRINLEDIQRELSKIKKITEPEITAIKDDDIQFNIFPITKSNMMYSSNFYSSFKMIFKNLQIINSNENEITEEELEEINNDLKKLYINLIKNFNVNTINAQESELKDIIVALTEEGLSLKNKYESYIKKGGDVKGEVDEGEGEGEDGKVKGEVDGEGEGENVKNLEEEAERKQKEAEEAKKKTEDEAAAAKNKAEEEAKNKAEEEAKKKTEDEAAAAKNKAEEEAKKKADEEAKKKTDDEAKKKAEEETFVLNFEYNNNSCYVNSVLQMLIDNDKLCDEIVNVANNKLTTDENFKTFTDDAPVLSNDYLLYLLNKIIIYHRRVKHPIGKPKKPSYNDYILPLRKYLLLLDKEAYYFNNHGEVVKLFETIIKNLQSFSVYLQNVYKCTQPIKVGEDYYCSYLTMNISLNLLDDVDTSITLQSFINDKFITSIIQNYKANNTIILAKDVKEAKDIIINTILQPDTDDLIISTEGYSRSVQINKKVNLSKILFLNSFESTNYFDFNVIKDKKAIYILQGFIYFVSSGHFTYYKSLSKYTNNENDKWVLLDDFDKNDAGDRVQPQTDKNDQLKVFNGADGLVVVGKNGKYIDQKDVPIDRAVMYYYKKYNADNATEEEKREVAIAETALNASPIGVENRTNTEEDDPEIKAAIAASLADQNSEQPVGVANVTEPSLKYTFDTRNPFTPIYEENNEDVNKYYKGAKFVASLNAGHESLYVGGRGTINGAFNQFFSNDDNYDDNVLKEEYIKMHISCYMNKYDVKEDDKFIIDNTSYQKILKVMGEVNKKYIKPKTDNNNHYTEIFKFYKFKEFFPNNKFIEEMYLYISEERLEKFKFSRTNIYPGDVFIDILKKPPYSFDNKNVHPSMHIAVNKAMIYCTGPENLSDNVGFKGHTPADFLLAVKIVGKNIANAICNYNNTVSNNKKIDYARICLISGSQFKGANVKAEDVANNIIQGIIEVNSARGVKDIEYNFADYPQYFKKAYDKLK